ncbi:tetratricopeptide repeat protein [Phenylobacterium deserti]|uniref:tetratricopeptide repeat protein n=1 Tax=Phenylobacterium deserti TaxID=1914756 RepID=UPI001402FF60|nr:tetratricopeptide repeat protein [Phenylobacterium deserti]
MSRNDRTDLFAAAVAAQRAFDFEGAAGLFEQLLDARPFEAAHNLAVIRVQQGRTAQAEALFRRALAQKPDAPWTRLALGSLYLQQGRYAEGWPLYEARRQVPGEAREPPHILPDLRAPEWRGEPIAGKRLLVLPEQGFGDVIMFSRFLAQLRSAGAEPVLAGLHKPLQPLFPDAVVLRRSQPPPEVDFWTVLGSLPFRLNATLETVPPPGALGPSRRGGGGVGVMARGNPKFAYDFTRSLPAAAAERLLALGADLHPDSTGAADFRQTAEIIAGLDLVITVDTAVAHLAGSMGTPVWILLPAVNRDWRWLEAREDSPWYPSARLFRQAGLGAWDALVDRVVREASRVIRAP